MALWGGRFTEERKNSVRDFTESISYDKRLYKYDIQGSCAHAAMLAEQGIIPQSSADAIIAELKNIQERIEKGDFTFTADLEDIHMHIESELIANLGDDGARVHTARSRNDQVCLDIRLYLRDECAKIASEILTLQQALVSKGNEYKDVILPGFTHLQHAQPILFAHHLLAYAEMLERDRSRLLDARKRLNVLPLGSGAIAGTTLPINRESVMKKLNFPACSRNSMDAVASRDFSCEVLSALAIFAMHISRLSEDIILWMSQEFSFVMLADSFCTGSSLMPQKKNPDIAELSRGKTGRIYGALLSLLTICKGLPLTYNRDLQEDKEGLFDAIDTVHSILSVYPPMIGTMTANRENMWKAACDPGLLATDLAEALVRKGVPFRSAHHKVGALVRFAGEHNKGLDEVTLEEMKSVFPEADESMLAIFSSPKGAVEGRDIFGGTGSRQVEAQLAFWQSHLTEEEKEMEKLLS